MIEIKSSTGEIVSIKKLKVVTGDSRAEATSEFEAKERLATTIVEGETFVFSVDGVGIAMHPVESSSLGHLGWFDGEMFATFKGKDGFTLYSYKDVSDTRFVDLVNAKSIGRRFGLMKDESLKNYQRFF
jgi:hypothetical protein